MRLILTAFLFSFSTFLLSQTKIDKVLRNNNAQSVPYIHVEALLEKDNVVLLDTRRKEEYEVSHLKNAVWVGYKAFDLDTMLAKIPNKNTAIVVYCSIGVRSENIGEKLLKAGYINVKNLYGGIFEWKNKKNIVYDSNENETEKIHVLSKHWGKLLTNGEKVYF